MDAFFQRLWYGESRFAFVLLPLSWLFALISMLRRSLFSLGALRSVRVAKPVIVVGNITVGGTGKTPFVMWLVGALRDRGYSPGVITRGYGGSASEWPRVVTSTSDPLEVGDEAVLLAERTSALVIAGPDRVKSAQRAIELGANVIVSDDGLQHYRLIRDFEIAVVDAVRRFGNGWRLPAGPLREPTSRLNGVGAVVLHRREAATSADDSLGHSLEIVMRSNLGSARCLATNEVRAITAFVGQRVHAVAGIGNPAAFFDALRSHGLRVEAHALPDHASMEASVLKFGDDAPVLMTQKDAVKCRTFADTRCWSVELVVEVKGSGALLDAVARKLDSRA